MRMETEEELFQSSLAMSMEGDHVNGEMTATNENIHLR